MKILIITMNVGRNAPGIVFEKLIKGISRVHNLDVLTADNDPSIDLSMVQNVIVSKKIKIHIRIHKLLVSLFGFDPYDLFWAWKSLIITRIKGLNKYDVVFSFISSYHYASLIAGVIIARLLRSKLAVYSVDAIPVPKNWPEDPRYYKGIKRFINKYLSETNAFFASNIKMLSYELSFFKPSKNIINDVIYNPCIGDFRYFPVVKGNNNFVYTGGIYGARKVNYLFMAFEKLLKIYPNSYLIFVGTQLSQLNLQSISQQIQDKIRVYPFMKNLDRFYENATALLDIDADLVNDIYLSSKIINYIMINRIIIAETGNDSPSHNLFKSIDSIILCNHDSNQIFEAMKKSILLKNNISFEDRKTIINKLSLDNAVMHLNSIFKRLVEVNSNYIP